MASTSIDKQIMDQALDWVVRLRSENVSESEISQFADWLADSELHRLAWDMALDTWETTDALSYLPLDELLQEPKKATVHSFTDRLARAWRPLAVAASLLIAVVAVLTFTRTDAVYYQTGIGEYRAVTLEDGSVIELNTNTLVEVLFEGNSRDIELVRGEAYFNVMPDKASPFTVNFGNASARALGTAFNVYRQTDAKTIVTVTEGVVRVSELAGSATSSAQSELLLANHSIAIDATRGLSEALVVESEEIVVWRDRQIVFSGTPLLEAIDVLNRYLESKIVLSETTSTSLKVSGVFSSKQQDEMVLAVAQALDLDVIKQDEVWLLSQPQP